VASNPINQLNQQHHKTKINLQALTPIKANHTLYSSYLGLWSNSFLGMVVIYLTLTLQCQYATVAAVININLHTTGCQ